MEQSTTALDDAIKSLDIVVAGRHFRTSEATTFEQDMYVYQILEETGLKALANDYDPLEADIGDVASKVIITAFGSGKLFQLLGAILTEVDVPWTVSSAKDNGFFFSQLRDQKDKEALKSTLVSVILGFFVNGLLSSKTSKTYSLVSREMQPESTEPSGE